MRNTWYRGRIVLTLVGAIAALSAGHGFASEAKAQYLLQRADAKLRDAEIAAAEQFYAEALQESPSNVGIAMALAEFYILQHRFDNATALIDSQIQNHPDDFRVWKMKGVVAQMSNAPEQTIVNFEKAYTLPGGNEDGLIVTTLQQHYEATGNSARRQQMENSLQWVRIKNSH